MQNNFRLDNGEFGATRFSGEDGKKMKFPKPPKKGEVMYCQVCGQPMLPKDFSSNETLRRREFKWQIHSRCFEDMDAMADRSVPGLLAERKQREQKK